MAALSSQAKEVSLDEPQQQQPEVSLTDRPTVPLPENTVADRAAKFNTAWPDGPNKPSHDDLKASIKGGAERDLRVQLANETQMAHNQMKIGMVNDLVRHKTKAGETDFTDAEKSLIQTDTPAPNPDDVMEQEFGRRYVSNVFGKTDSPNHPFNVSQRMMPGVFSEDADFASDMKARNTSLLTLKQDNDATLSNEGMVRWSLQQAKGLVPFWQGSDVTGATNEDWTNVFTPGSGLETRLQEIWALPTHGQFMDAMRQLIEPLDPVERSQVLEQAMTMSASGTTISNLGAIADTALVAEGAVKVGMVASRIIGAGGRTVTKATVAETEKAIQAHREALTSVVREPVGPSDPIANLERAGDVKGAAEIGVIQQETKAFPLGGIQDKLELAREMPGWFNFMPRLEDMGQLSRAYRQRLYDAMAARTQQIGNMLGELKGTSLDRMGETALGKAFELAEADLRDNFTGANDAIMDVRRIRDGEVGVSRVEAVIGKTPSVRSVQGPGLEEIPVGGFLEKPAGSDKWLMNTPDNEFFQVGSGRVQQEIVIGKPEATLFADPDEARAYGEWYGLADDQYKIKPQGNGYYISITKAVDETKGQVKDLLVVDSANANPESTANALFGKWRTAADLLPALQRGNRMLSLMAPNRFKEQVQEIAEKLTDLSRRDRDELGRIAAIGRDMQNLDNPSLRGYFFKSVGELETAFLRNLQKPPSAAQIDAYFTYVDLSRMEYFMRNLAFRRDLERQGVEQVKFYYHNGEQVMETPHLWARKVDDLPWASSEDFHVWDADTKGPANVFTQRRDMDHLKDYVKQGRKVYQIANPANLPLSDVTGKKIPIHFVVTDKFEYKPLDAQLIRDNPGGHSIYPGQAFVKQPTVEPGLKGILHYLGDKSIYNFSTMRQAVKAAGLLDEARLAIKNGTENLLPDILARGLPGTVGQIKALFKDGGHLSLEHPIVATRTNERAIDGMYQGRTLRDLDTYNPKGERFRDELNSSYNLMRNVDNEFLQDKDAILPTIKKGDREGDPIFHYAPAKQLDPWQALQRGIGGAIRQRWLNDYKTGAVDQWIESFKSLFEAGKLAQVRANPLPYFFNAKLTKSAATYGEVQKAEASRAAIMNFLGVQTELGEKIDWMRWKMVDGLYDALSRVSPKYGEKFANSDFITNFLTPGKIDPARYMRNMAFHVTIGLFNPIRYLLHAAYSTHVLAIAGPTRGYQGMVASGLLQYMTMHGWTEDADLIAHVAKMARGMGGWSEDEFKEMYGALKDSGWGIVGNESAWKQDVFDPKLFKSNAGKFLDAGTWFFRKGEQFSRLSAFGAAYKEWKAANPVAQLTQRELGSILTRADDLSLNMTKASLSGWQRGWLGVMTQFKTYNMRFMEQVLPGVFGKSNRITQAEALRAVGVYSLLYGIPATAGGVLGFLPVYEMLQKAAFDNGINLHESWKQPFNDGILSSSVNFASELMGGDRAYNFPQRYGAYADQDMYDYVLGNKGLLDVLMGPSGEMIGQAAHAIWPGFYGLSKFLQGKPEEYPVRITDVLDAFRRVGAVSQWFKFGMATVYGAYYDQNYKLVSNNLDTFDGLTMLLTGLTPREISDNTLMQGAQRDVEAYQKKWGDDYQRNFRLAMQAYKSGNEQEGNAYLQRAQTAKVLGNFSPKDLLKLQRQAVRQNELTEIQQTRYNFWRYSPESQRQDRLNMIEDMNQNGR